MRMNPVRTLDLAGLLGASGREYVQAVRAAQAYLAGHDQKALLARVGSTIDELPHTPPFSKEIFQKSYGGGKTGATDDLLAGEGIFYITEQRKLFLDCTSGHYQMLWGYHPPALCELIEQAEKLGIVWDNHSNIPQAPVKALAWRLAELGGETDVVLLGICTGSVACAAAMKMQLVYFERTRPENATPVFIALDGNYHGTDMVAQNLRGMWRKYVQNIIVENVQPNDERQLRDVFARHGRNVAAFWAEPIMMNREAIRVDPAYLQLVQQLCHEADAAFCVDEIQTGFWQKEIFYSRKIGLSPDMLITGKGMTAGYHPLSAVVYRRKYDVLEQYDAISTNGQAAMASLVALGNIEMISRDGAKIDAVGQRYHRLLCALAGRHGGVVEGSRGDAHMSALKFRRREDALAFHARCIEAGLWLRAHAYHEGHSTILTKLSLPVDDEVVDFIIAKLDALLAERRKQ